MIVPVLNFILQTKSLFSCFSICMVYWPSEFRHNNLQHMLESHLKAINQQIFLLIGTLGCMNRTCTLLRVQPLLKGCQIRQNQHWYLILIRAGIQLSVVLGLLLEVNKLNHSAFHAPFTHFDSWLVWDY